MHVRIIQDSGMEVYIQSASGYVGEWIELDGMDSETFLEEVRLLNHKSGEEVFITDSKNFYGFPVEKFVLNNFHQYMRSFGMFLDFLDELNLGSETDDLKIFLEYLRDNLDSLSFEHPVELRDLYVEAQNKYMEG